MARIPRGAATASRDDLVSLLRDTTSDEKGGVTATLGFSFQQWWAALCVVELLESDGDFAVGLEVKEDVAVLDSANTPTTVEFCQVKKSEQSGLWTLAHLKAKGTKRKDGTREHSILGKLYTRKLEFSGHPVRLRFVSNVGFSVPEASGKAVPTHDTCLDTLPTGDADKLRDELAAQLGKLRADIDHAALRVHRTNLPLGEQELFVGGKLSELSATGRLPFTLTQTTVAARVLASEVQSKASDTSFSRNFAELRARLISRKDAVDILSAVAASKPPVQVALDEAIASLERANHPFVQVRGIKEERVRVCAHASDRTNMQFRTVVFALEAAAKVVESDIGQQATLGELMDEAVEKARADASQDLAGTSLSYLRAVALLVLTHALDIHLQPAATRAQPEEPL